MSDALTILLAPPRADVEEELRALRGDLQVVPLNGPQAAERIDGRVIAFIDWILPDMSGLEFCRRLRESETVRNAHLTLILEDGDADARRRAMAAGADDYMAGPLSARALLARIDAVSPDLGRPASSPRLRQGDLSVDPAAFQVRFKGRLLPLRPNEFRLLVHFMQHPDQVFSRCALIDRLGKDAGTIDERTVDVWVGRLRRALRAQGVPDPLRTVRALGYVLDSEPL